jgi:chorismate dehydratase
MMKNRKLRLGKIKYANMTPIYHVFDKEGVPPWLELVEQDPATLNNLMMEGALDVSPVSSVAYAENCDKWDLLPGLCISCRGRVMSVILALRGSLEDLDKAPLYLSKESATSVQLLKLIMEKEGLGPKYRSWDSSHANGLPGDGMGALLIGDRALHWIYNLRSPLFIDMGEYWYSWTGLPFVFAVWAVRRSASDQFRSNIKELLDFFNLSLKVFESEIDSITKPLAARMNLPFKLVQRYFECLNYRFGEKETKGMKYFFELLEAKGSVGSRIKISFVNM